MILNFEDKQYIDVDSIKTLRFFPESETNPAYGIIIIGGDKITVTKEQFDIIEKAYVWAVGSAMYDKELKRIRG